MGSQSRAARGALRAARAELRSARADLERLEGSGTRRTVPASMVVCLVGVVALMVAVAVTVVLRVGSPARTDADILASARDLVAPLLTPDARDPDRAGQILDDATGTFRDEFAQSSGAWSAVVARLGTQTTGDVDGVALASRSGDDASVLVTAVLVTRRADASPDTADPRRLRLVVEVAPDGGRLALADVRLVP